MIPLRDDNPTELTPVVTVALILANVAVWLYVQGAGMSEGVLVQSVCRYGTIPAEVTGAAEGHGYVELAPGTVCELGGLRWATLVTGMFLHGSWLHLIGNMWFLWLFGNNIEDSMGHLRFLVFYMLTGLAADGAHILSEPASVLPTVGASGAISGVMGAYLVLYPRIRIETLFIFVIFIKIFAIPAWVVLAEWFLVQLLSSTTMAAGEGGVAFWAHIGGFVVGLALVKPFENRQLVEARKRHVKLDPREIEGRGWL